MISFKKGLYPHFLSMFHFRMNGIFLLCLTFESLFLYSMEDTTTGVCSAVCRCRMALHQFRVNCRMLMLDHVPTDLPAEATKLNMDINQIQELPKNAFVTLVNLEMLYIRSNNISAIKTGAFSGMVELKSLDLSGNRITYIPQDIFKDNVKLEILILSFNLIPSVPDFIPMPPLRELHLERNHIHNAKFSNSFRNISLAAIYLDNNPIKVIKNSDFKSLQENGGRLTQISLSHCNLTYIEPETFVSQRNLELLSFSYNPYNFTFREHLPNKHVRENHNENVSSVSQLYLDGLFRNGLSQNVFSRLEKQPVRSLSLNDNIIPALYNNSFIHLPKLKYLSLRNSAIQTLEPKAFHGLNKLNILDLSLNMFAYFPSGLPEHLKILIMDGNHNMKVIQAFTFSGSPNLEQIHLRNCSISIIHKAGFSDLKKLSFIDLRNNHLTHSTILQSTFSQLIKLDILLLGTNPLGSIKEQNTFSGLESLRKLDISNAKITEINELVFKPLKSLVYLDLSGNLMHQVLQDNGDVLKNLPLLHFLSLSNNNIVNVNKSMFQYSKVLKNLDLSNNKLVSWNSELFSKLTSLRYLRLDNNRITFIHEGMMHALSNLKSLALSGNPLNCDCHMGWILPWFKTSKTRLVDADQTKCATHSQVAGRKLMDLTEGQFTCPTPWYYILFIVIISLCCIGIVVTVVWFRFQSNIRDYILKSRRSHEKAMESEKEMILIEKPEDEFI